MSFKLIYLDLDSCKLLNDLVFFIVNFINQFLKKISKLNCEFLKKYFFQ